VSKTRCTAYIPVSSNTQNDYCVATIRVTQTAHITQQKRVLEQAHKNTCRHDVLAGVAAARNTAPLEITDS